MDQLTSDIRGVAVYLDNLLVSSANAEEHLQNLRSLLQCLQDKAYRIGAHKMPPPTNTSALHSFLSSVQFYSKFVRSISRVTEPLTFLTS